jgi:hypothetical protein
MDVGWAPCWKSTPTKSEDAMLRTVEGGLPPLDCYLWPPVKSTQLSKSFWMRQSKRNLLNQCIKAVLPFVSIALFSAVHIVLSNSVLAGEAELRPRRKAAALNAYYQGWLNSLDSCPCTKSDMESEFYKKRFEPAEGYFTEKLSEIYHPGASHEYRSRKEAVRPFPATKNPSGKKLDPLMPGQQCVYDSRGNLITHGPAAGTPDAYAPNATYYLQGSVLGRLISGNTNSHTYWDESTFDPNGLRFGRNGLTWIEYQKTWVPNNGNRCQKNPSGGSISVEVHENPRATIQYEAAGGLWDLPYPYPGAKESIEITRVTSPDIKICIDNTCLPPCLDSYLCFYGNLLLRAGQRVYVSLTDIDLFVDDIIGSGFCIVGLPCPVGAASVYLMP